MGEEHGETNPFLYFVSHGDPALVEAVREGRRREFETFAWAGEVPDPQAEDTFEASRPRWEQAESAAGARLRALYRDLLRLRRAEAALAPRRRGECGSGTMRRRDGWRCVTQREGDGAGGDLQSVIRGASRAAGRDAPVERGALQRRTGIRRLGGGGDRAGAPVAGAHRRPAPGGRDHESLARLSRAARRDLGRRRHQLRHLLGARDGGGPLPVQPAGGRTRIRQDPAARADRSDLARLSAGRPARPALRLPGARPVRARGGPPVQSGQAAPRPVRQGDQRRDPVERRALRLLHGAADREPGPRPRSVGQRRGAAQVRRRRVGVQLGRRQESPDAVEPHRDLRVPRQGDDDAAPRRARGDPRHVPRARHRSDHRSPAFPRRHGGRAAPGAPLRDRAPPRRDGPGELLGVQQHRLLRARRPVRHRGPRAAGRRVQVHGEAVPSRRDRGHPRRGLQPHGGGQPSRPHALLPRDRQRRLLPARSREPAVLRGLHRDRQHARHPPLADHAAGDGQPAVLGRGHARGRIPLRSRAGARAGRRGREPLRRVLRRGAPGPGRLPA